MNNKVDPKNTRLIGEIKGVTVKKADEPLLVRELVAILKSNFAQDAMVFLGDNKPCRGVDVIHPSSSRMKMVIMRNPRNTLL